MSILTTRAPWCVLGSSVASRPRSSSGHLSTIYSLAILQAWKSLAALGSLWNRTERQKHRLGDWPIAERPANHLHRLESILTVKRNRSELGIDYVDHHLVTVIQLLSPSNKTPVAAANLARRHEQLIRIGVNVVEIDLIRGGLRTLPELLTAELKETSLQTTYLIIVGKAHCPDERQVYYCPLRDRLPAFAIPLRATDNSVPLDLQPLIDRCYQTGRYWQLSQRPLPPPALTADEQAWVDQQRAAAGLIDA